MKTLGPKILKGSAIVFFVLAGFYLIIGLKAVIEGSEGVEMLGTIFWIVCLFTTVGGLLFANITRRKRKTIILVIGRITHNYEFILWKH